MDTNELVSEAEDLGALILPSVVKIIVKELDPTCDITGAVTASQGILTNIENLVTALRTKTAAAAAA